MADYTIWGSFDDALTQYIRPYIEVDWTQNQAQNTSTVTATLYFRRYTNNYWSYNEFEDSRGHSCTFSVGGSSLTEIRPFNLDKSPPPNGVAVWTRTRTITHNSNGTASVNISAEGSTNVNPDTYSFGESVTLPTIPRQTEINSVSMSNQLRPSTSNSLSVSLDRKHSNYTHRFEILNGSTVLQSAPGGLITSANVLSSTVDKMIDLMKTVKTRNFTFRVVTLSGNTVIGSKTKNFSVTLDNSYTSPTISSFSTAIIGTGRDKTINKYVQNISRVRTQFNADYGRGATRQSMSVRVDGRAVSGSVLSSGVYRSDSDVLSKSGTITITVTATNSRGQSTSDTRDITVHEYSPPSIQEFTLVRSETNPTNIIVSRRYYRTSLDGDNIPTTGVIERQAFGSSTWTEVNDSNLLTLSTTLTGNSETTSYTFRTTITDKMGNSATSEVSVGTAKVLMEKYKDEGVSFGKRFETGRGTLQVGGDIYHVSESGVASSLTSTTLISANLMNGWSHNAVASYGGAGYYKIGGIVYFYGLIANGIDGTIFTLSPGYRPKQRIRAYGIQGDNRFTRIDVLENGNVNVYNSISNFMSLAHISFGVE